MRSIKSDFLELLLAWMVWKWPCPIDSTWLEGLKRLLFQSHDYSKRSGVSKFRKLVVVGVRKPHQKLSHTFSCTNFMLGRSHMVRRPETTSDTNFQYWVCAGVSKFVKWLIVLITGVRKPSQKYHIHFYINPTWLEGLKSLLFQSLQASRKTMFGKSDKSETPRLGTKAA